MSNESNTYDIEEIGFYWYKYGCENHDPSYVRFLAHWMAFNWLYSEEHDSLESNTETALIRRYVFHHIDLLERVTDFRDQMYKPLLREKVEGMGLWKYDNSLETDWPEINYRDLCNENLPKKRRILALFMTMYQVRCNLFHGQKNPNCARDRELVNATAIILEHYLGAIVPDDFKIKNNLSIDKTLLPHIN